VLWQL